MIGKDSKTLTVGTLSGWHGIDPWEAQDLAAAMIRAQCFEPLLERVGGGFTTNDRLLTDGLQREKTLSGQRWSLRINPAARFSDGTKVTAYNVVSALRRNGSLRRLLDIQPDGDRLFLSTQDSTLELEPLLARNSSVIAKRDGDGWLGTGPYAFENAGDQFVSLMRNYHWAGVQPDFDRIVFRAFPPDEDGKATALERALNDGSIDFTMMLPREVVMRLEGVRKIFRPGQSTGYLGFAVHRPWLENVDARRAVARSLDRRALARLCYENPTTFLARGLLPPSMAPEVYESHSSGSYLFPDESGLRGRADESSARMRLAADDSSANWRLAEDSMIGRADDSGSRWRSDDSSARMRAEDSGSRRQVARAREKAKRAIKSIGLPTHPLKMLVVWGPRPYLPAPMKVADAIAAQLGELGIIVEIEQASGPRGFLNAVRRGRHDMILAGFIAETPEAADFLEAVLASTRVADPDTPLVNVSNFSGFADPRLDRDIAMAKRNPCRETLESVLDTARRECPVVPLMHGATVVAHSWRMRNFELDEMGLPDFAKVKVSPV